MGILAGKPPFWGFLVVLGPPDPSRRRGFTSTPRAGAPRFPVGVAAPAGSPPRVEGDPPVRGPRNEPKARAPRLARLLGKGDDKQTRGAPAKTVIESQKLTSNYHTSHARGPRRPGGTSAPCRPGPQTPGVPRREPRGPAARGWCKTPSGRGLPGAWEAQGGPRTLSGRTVPGPRSRRPGPRGSWSPGVPRPQGLGKALSGPRGPGGLRNPVPGARR